MIPMQPFEDFKEVYIDGLFKLNKNFLVTQTYNRAPPVVTDSGRVAILLTDYDDAGLAKTHLNAVKHDKYASIIQLEKEAHKQKLRDMVKPGSIYQLYWSIVRDASQMAERLNNRYSSNMRRYIQHHTNWRISSDEQIIPRLQITFGELFIILKRGSQTIRVKFEEIEQS